MQITSVIALTAAVAFALPAAAQRAPDTRILRGAEVTEKNVIDSLDPVLTRTLRIKSDQPDAKTSASLLITFETNSATINASDKEQLNAVGRALNQNKLLPYSFAVEGHADPRGSPHSNLVLSQRRAESVRNYLVSNHSIDPERLKALGKGDQEPIHPENPAAAENRRVTIVTNVPR